MEIFHYKTNLNAFYHIFLQLINCPMNYLAIKNYLNLENYLLSF